jgi:FtsZ-binding cell division protein ZapB
MSLNLFEISREYRAAADTLVELDLDEETLKDTLESISGDLETKAQNIGFVIKNIEASAEQIKAHAKAMMDRAKALENRASSVKQYLFDGMRLANVPKIDTPYFKLAIRDNPPSVQIDDESVIPAEYKTDPLPPVPAPDKSLIKKAILDGFEVPGCRLVRGQRLDIR